MVLGSSLVGPGPPATDQHRKVDPIDSDPEAEKDVPQTWY